MLIIFDDVFVNAGFGFWATLDFHCLKKAKSSSLSFSWTEPSIGATKYKNLHEFAIGSRLLDDSWTKNAYWISSCANGLEWFGYFTSVLQRFTAATAPGTIIFFHRVVAVAEAEKLGLEVFSEEADHSCCPPTPWWKSVMNPLVKYGKVTHWDFLRLVFGVLVIAVIFWLGLGISASCFSAFCVSLFSASLLFRSLLFLLLCFPVVLFLSVCALLLLCFFPASCGFAALLLAAPLLLFLTVSLFFCFFCGILSYLYTSLLSCFQIIFFWGVWINSPERSLNKPERNPEDTVKKPLKNPQGTAKKALNETGKKP